MYQYEAKILSVYDGDGVFNAEVDMGMNLFQHKDLRLYGVDTPEMRGVQKKAGKIVRDFVRGLILNKYVTIRTHKDKTGKYGRLLVSIMVKHDSKGLEMDLGELLIQKGYAKHYLGKKKEPWAKQELSKIINN